ncbi:MAG: tRNA (adenosine(37)-N6)-dimethylallyltransferase MiaA [Anaerolineales bacterium]|nr:tRNA (adenosine(37)-N6)-dimethylallyltransferase MiaA [Anaerolineales bacterium]
MSLEKLPLVAILGPTAVGKTELALRLAEEFQGEIISADSRLLYRGMDIGTAKPTPEERRRVPHHLIDVASPDETWSLARVQAAVRQAAREICSRGRLPFLVGGAGQYLRAIIQGWQAPAAPPDPRLRAALERWAAGITPVGLHQRLSRLDPQAAQNLDPRNLRRTVRALEVILSTGRLFSQQRRQGESPYQLLLLGLTRPRQELYQRIDARVEAMLAAGLVDEVRALLEAGAPPNSPALSAIGYREIIDYLRGVYNLEEAIARIKRDTRLLVRRQANWFKAQDPQIVWFQVDERTQGRMAAVIADWRAERGLTPEALTCLADIQAE